MQQVTQDNWNSVAEKDTVILQFSAPWCGPCKNQSQVLDEIATTNINAFFGKVDIEEENDIASTFKVMSVPTIVFLKNGKESKRFVGFQSKQKIQEAMSA